VPRWETTRELEVERHAKLVEHVRRRPKIRKLQRTLNELAGLWSGPEELHSCIGGFRHYQVRPDAAAVAAVAAHAEDDRLEIRRAVFAALAHAGTHGAEATPAARTGLGDTDPLVRLHAARAAVAFGLGETLRDQLLTRLGDPVWSVRWLAARALAARGVNMSAVEAALLGSRPRVGDGDDTRFLEEWAQAGRWLWDMGTLAAVAGRPIPWLPEETPGQAP
jgi:hypothetical protein